ncbi:hypothetical protein [Parapedobacter sp. DT-150]|uniref:hypothetical protein n=1 Tax=Parapedobacter sp. DT-150 TaxID=3396162 RepID=UPI003F1CDC74
MGRKYTMQELRKLVKFRQRIKPFNSLMYFFLSIIVIGVSIRIINHYSTDFMLIAILTLVGLACFALFFKAIAFFEKI